MVWLYLELSLTNFELFIHIIVTSNYDGRLESKVTNPNQMDPNPTWIRWILSRVYVMKNNIKNHLTWKIMQKKRKYMHFKCYYLIRSEPTRLESNLWLGQVLKYTNYAHRNSIRLKLWPVRVGPDPTHWVWLPHLHWTNNLKRSNSPC